MKKQTKLALGLAALALLLAFTATACKKGKEEQRDIPVAWVNPLEGERPSSSYLPEVPDVSEPLAQAKASNPDAVGWLQVPGTAINEVVVQTTDNNFYYRRDALKNYSFAGSLWMDFESRLGSGVAADMSQNVIIYGHNLGSPQGVKDDPEGVKFAQLLKFDDEAFAKAHPYFYFTTTNGEQHIYEIFTVFYSEDVLTPVPYHYAEFSPEDYAKLIADVRDRSQFDYNVGMSPADKIMTLSTCTYKYGTYSKNPHQRFVVMGRLLDENDNMYPSAELKVNPDPKAPSFK